MTQILHFVQVHVDLKKNLKSINLPSMLSLKCNTLQYKLLILFAIMSSMMLWLSHKHQIFVVLYNMFKDENV